MIAIDQALYSTLNNDTTLLGLATGGVYQLTAPQNTVPPYVLFTQYGLASQPWTFGNGQPYTLYDYQVRTFTAGMDFSVNETILARVKVLLEDAALSIAGYSLMVCRVNKIGAPLMPPGDVFGGMPSCILDHYYTIGVS